MSRRARDQPVLCLVDPFLQEDCLRKRACLEEAMRQRRYHHGRDNALFFDGNLLVAFWCLVSQALDDGW